MATTINTGEINRLNKILIDVKSEMNSYFSRSKTALQGISDEITGTTTLDSDCKTFQQDIDESCNNIVSSIDECIRFLESQVTQYVQTTEQASSDMISFMLSLVNDLGLNGTITIPKSIYHMEVSINSNVSIDNILSNIDDITSDISRIRSSLVTFRYIASQIQQHWQSDSVDLGSTIARIEETSNRIEGVIIPYLTKYTVVFTNLLENQKSISSSTVNSGVTFSGYAARVAETK